MKEQESGEFIINSDFRVYRYLRAAYIHISGFKIFISAVRTEYETCHNFTNNNTSFHVTITTNITNSNNMHLNKYIKYKLYLHFKSIDAYWDNRQSTCTPLLFLNC
jgi:hypothetical protein